MNQRTRSGIKVMAGLIGMIRPLLGFMALAILMGCAGNLMATFITVLGGYGLLTAAGAWQRKPWGDLCPDHRLCCSPRDLALRGAGQQSFYRL